MTQAWQTDIAESISTTPAAGLLAENVAHLRSSVQADVTIQPGWLMCPGSADGKAKVPTSAAEVLTSLGCAVLMPLKSESAVNGQNFIAGDAVLYLEKGEIWVHVEAAVTAGQQALFRHTANGGGGFPTVGEWRGDANTGAGVVPASRFTSTTVGAGFAKVRINLPATA